MKTLEFAIQLAKNAFKEKTDLSGKPYIDHLTRVMEAVPNYGSGELKQIAILHDILEDCPEWNCKSLRQLFSDRVVDSVWVLTKRDKEPYGSYIERIIDSEDGWAKEVKLADLRDNMNLTRLSKLTDKDIERLKKYHNAYLRLLE
jgi:(p)ppGpp synthase/HD superfamily hydrolase